MKKFIVNAHTYEGFGGETTDSMEIYNTYKEAYEHYLERKDVCGQADSFVQLFELYDTSCSVLLRAYYYGGEGATNEYEREYYEDGEYVRKRTKVVNGEVEYVPYYEESEEYGV